MLRLRIFAGHFFFVLGWTRGSVLFTGYAFSWSRSTTIFLTFAIPEFGLRCMVLLPYTGLVGCEVEISNIFH